MTMTDRLAGINEGVAVKAPCVAATTANITLSGTQTIDGVAVVAGDRVLVKDQTTGSQNGIYVVSTGNWERAKDFNGSRDVVRGTRVYVINGSVNGQLDFVLTTVSPVIGTSALSWSAITNLYNPGRTGSVSRSLQSKLKEEVSVTDFLTGQVPSSTPAVNTAAFQYAIDSVAADGGGIVWVPPGRFIVDPATTIAIKQGVILRGYGREVSIIQAGGGLTVDMVSSYYDDTAILDLTLDGGDYSAASSTGSTGSAPAVTGTATAGGASTLTDSGKSWTTNQWSGFEVYITGGTGFNQHRTISTNTSTVLTVSSAWTTQPDATSTYSIRYKTITLTGVSGTPTAGWMLDGDDDIGNNALVSSYDSGTGVLTTTVGNAGAVSGAVTMNPLVGLLAVGHGASRIRVQNCNFVRWRLFAFVYNGVTDLWFTDNYIKRTTTSKRQNQSILGSASWAANKRIRIRDNTLLNSAIDVDLHDSIVTSNLIDTFAFGAGITYELSATTYNVVTTGNIISGGTGTDVNLTCCAGLEVYAKTSVYGMNIVYSNSGPGMASLGDYDAIGLNILYDNGQTQNDSGITVNYASATATGSYGAIGLNVSFNTIGASGPQGYALNITNASCGYNVVGLNNFNNLRTRPTRDIGFATQELTPVINGSEPGTPGTITDGNVYGPVSVNVVGLKAGNKLLAGYSQDLKGCFITAEWHSDNLAYAYIHNETGSSQTLTSGTIHVQAFYQQAFPNY